MKQPIGHLRPARPSFPAKSAVGACFLLLFHVCCLRASDLPAPVTLDLPIPANQALPTWLGQPETPATTFATLDLPILTPTTTASLLVTVYFQEKQGGFMRISWQGTQGAQVLSDNFYEDIGMANQRSLLISPATLIGDGTLATVDNQIDPTTGTVRLRATFNNENESLFPNQFVNARLLVEEKQGVVLIPTATVQRNVQVTYVYLVVPPEQWSRANEVIDNLE